MDYIEKIEQILKEIKGYEFLEMEYLVTGGFLSSFEVLQVIEKLEDQFRIQIVLEDITPETFNSVNSIKGLVLKYKNEV